MALKQAFENNATHRVLFFFKHLYPGGTGKLRSLPRSYRCVLWRMFQDKVTNTLLLFPSRQILKLLWSKSIVYKKYFAYTVQKNTHTHCFAHLHILHKPMHFITSLSLFCSWSTGLVTIFCDGSCFGNGSQFATAGYVRSITLPVVVVSTPVYVCTNIKSCP